MNDKDEIKELFQKELGNYQAKVNPNLWNGIQAGLGSAGAATGAATSLGLVGKIVIGVSIAAAVTVGTLLVVNNEEKTPQNQELISDLKVEDSVSKESLNQIELKEEITIDSSNNEISSVDKEESKIETKSNSTEEKLQNESNDLQNESKNSSNNLTTQESKVVSQKVESKDEIEIVKDDINKSRSAPLLILPSPKDVLVSELANFNIQIVNQNNQYIAFKVEEIPNDAYVVWDFGDGTIDRTLNPEHFYTEAGEYAVKCTVKTDKEEVTKYIKVEILISGQIGDLPNVFTPNGDGNNDEFFVNCKNIKSFQLTIIDNQQNIIFSTNDVDFRWNGFDMSGQPVKEGTYFYIIVAEDESGNTINKYQQLRLQR